MQGLMMDMPLLLSGLIEYAADYHGATEIVSRTIEGDIQRYGYADAHRRIKRLAKAIAPKLATVKCFVLMAPEARMPRTGLANLLCYETLLAAEDDAYAWPQFDERNASTICYTSGTTGNPKGVVYSHRAAVLQTMLAASFDFLPGHRHGTLEVMMPMAPMFHGNAWNMPYLSCYTGSKLILPGRNYEPDKLYELIESEKVTLTAGVPTFWLILADWMDRNGKKFSTLRSTLSSGSAPPRALVAKLERDYGVETMQAWGMTEALMATSCSLKPGHGDLPFERRVDYRMKSGRAIFGVKTRIVDDEGKELARDGTAFGHLRAKGPWIASGYLKGEGGSALDDDGWLKTGDMATIDAEGHILLTDRSKVASWWLPDAVELVDKFPMTATGKVHKLTLRQQYKDYDLQAKEHASAPHRR